MLDVSPDRQRREWLEADDADDRIPEVSQGLLLLGRESNLLSAKFVCFTNIVLFDCLCSVICHLGGDSLGDLRSFSSNPDVATPSWFLSLEQEVAIH